jgi:O-antigen/teichoic acid export membrane protein
MFLNIFWMGLSSVTRLGTGLVLFILIARHLGPEEFGHYMYWYGFTFLCALPANYGLGNMLLKEVAQHPENVTNILSESLSLRLMLSASILACALVVATLVDRPELLLALLFAHLIEAISDTLYVTYRALGHYARESQLAACAAVIQLVFITVAVMTNQNTGTIACIHLAGKVAQIALIIPVSWRTFGTFTLLPFYTIYRLAIRTKAYAIDYLLASTFGNIDSVILRMFSGIDIVGIYQSGMRIFQGGAQAAPILANVFLPEMARQALSKDRNPRVALILQTTFIVYGMIFGFILAYFPDQIVNLAFGKNYTQLATLLPFFGVLFFIRLFASAWGVILTAAGHQVYRAKSTAIHLVFMLILGSHLAYTMQAEGWLIALISANLLLWVLYMVYAVRSGFGISIVPGIGAMLAGGLLFVPAILKGS